MSPDARKDMKVTVRYQGPIEAPIAQGQEVASLIVAVPGKPARTVPLVAAEEVPSAGVFNNIWLGIRALTGSGT
jgi:D-alanyl-D-alanine carboxypeptidase (penicillin-binding protein 5/6)